MTVPLTLSLYLLFVILDNVLSIISHLRFIKCSPLSLSVLCPFEKLNLSLMAEHHYRVTQQYGGIIDIKLSHPLSRSTNRNMNHESKIM